MGGCFRRNVGVGERLAMLPATKTEAPFDSNLARLLAMKLTKSSNKFTGISTNHTFANSILLKIGAFK
jgi:hypothetical protein